MVLARDGESKVVDGTFPFRSDSYSLSLLRRDRSLAGQIRLVERVFSPRREGENEI